MEVLLVISYLLVIGGLYVLGFGLYNDSPKASSRGVVILLLSLLLFFIVSGIMEQREKAAITDDLNTGGIHQKIH